MLTIRLTRKGKKNQPFFRVVVIDKRRSSKGGRSVEDVGYLNPLTKKLSLNKERIQYWIKNGAQPSGTVHNLLVSDKVIEGKKVFKKSKKSDKPVEAVKPATPVAEAPAPAPEAPASEQPTA
jgi:small subunit ribosomal protein S16